jgi:hypothetical protein
MKKQKTLMILFLAFFFANVVFGQGCETLLMNGVFNTFNYNSGNYSSAEWHNFWCNGTVEKVTSNSSSDASLNIGIAKISLGMSFDDAKEFQKVYQSIYCGSTAGNKVNISTNSVIQKVASPEILTAYVKCKEIETGGLQVNLSLRPEDRKVFVIDVKYTKAWGNPSGPKVKKVRFVPDVISLKQGTLIDNIGLKTGITYSLICERSTDVPVTVYVETEVGTYSANLPSFIPPPTEQERIMSAMPKGTIIGWFDPLKIPKGWAICDGNNGTPDLNERSPIGTVSGKMGDKVGSSTHSHNINGNTSPAYFDNYDGQDNGPLEKLGDHRIMHHHTMNFNSGEASSLPPSTKIFFIMKL